MKKYLRRSLVLGLTALLAGCSWFQNSATEENTIEVEGARLAVETSVLVDETVNPTHGLRPGALLGVFVTDYLIRLTSVQSAMEGVNAQMTLIANGGEGEKTESFMLLEELGTALQEDVPDMLNRSINRSEAFDTYVKSLNDIGVRSSAHMEDLKTDLDGIRAERKAQRRETADIKSALTKALREQDYSTASDLQEQIIDAEGKLARVESEEATLSSIIKLFKDLLAVAQERLAAMNANREALIAGIKVTELPGVTELGILKLAKTTRTRGTGFDTILIDPNAN